MRGADRAKESGSITPRAARPVTLPGGARRGDSQVYVGGIGSCDLMNNSVAGSMTSKVQPLLAARQLPSMNSLSCMSCRRRACLSAAAGDEVLWADLPVDGQSAQQWIEEALGLLTQSRGGAVTD